MTKAAAPLRLVIGPWVLIGHWGLVIGIYSPLLSRHRMPDRDSRRGGASLRLHDPHAVEAAVDEEQGDGEKRRGQDMPQRARVSAFVLQCDSQLDREQAEERGELNDGVHRNAAG